MTIPLDDFTDHDLLVESTDYTRRIHWWARLFGVAWLVGIAFGLCVFAYIGIAAANANKFDDVNNSIYCRTYPSADICD